MFVLGKKWMFGNLVGYDEHHKFFGDLTKATPDGRFDGDMLTFGIGQGNGKDRDGLTALLSSVAKCDPYNILTGPSVTNIMLERQTKGNILNFVSNAACMDITGSYGASKQAVIKWARAFGKRYGHNGIIINGIAPGATFTPMIARYAHDINQEYKRHAIERFIRPDEIAEFAFYLMSDYGEIICGHTVVADGGDNAATL